MMVHKLKVFIAGSKNLATERLVIRNGLMQFQTRWDIMIEAKSFEDFGYSLTKDGRQNDYNLYITEEADLLIFVFASKVGNITMSEFMLGYSTFIKDSKPEILVFVEQNHEHIQEVEVLKQTMTNLNQYYIEYESIDDLRNLLAEELTKYISDHQELLMIDQVPPSTEKPEPWQQATLNECGLRAMQLALHLFFYHLASFSNNESQQSQMYANILDDLTFWGIDTGTFAMSESPADYCVNALKDKSMEYGLIASFCNEYLVVAYGHLAGQEKALAALHDKCNKLSRQVIVPLNIMEILPQKDDINAFSRCISVLNDFYKNYMDNVSECSACGKRLTKGSARCPYCGKQLTK